MISQANWIEGCGIEIPQHLRAELARKRMDDPLPHTQRYLKDLIKHSSLGQYDKIKEEFNKNNHQMFVGEGILRYFTGAICPQVHELSSNFDPSSYAVLNNLANENGFEKEARFLVFDSDRARISVANNEDTIFVLMSSSAYELSKKTKGSLRAIVKHEMWHVLEEERVSATSIDDRDPLREEFDADKYSVEAPYYEQPLINYLVKFDALEISRTSALKEVFQAIRKISELNYKNEKVAIAAKAIEDIEANWPLRVKKSKTHWLDASPTHPSLLERIQNLQGAGIEMRSSSGKGYW